VRKLFVHSFGCRASQADGAAIESALSARGWETAPASGDAQLVVLNTCTVTQAADHDLRQTVHRIHRENPSARIVVTGCYAQRAPEEISRIPGVAMVVGNSHKVQIPELIENHGDLPYHGQIWAGDIFAQQEFLSAPVEDALGDRTRPNLKIQDGCNNRCSFCIIPFVRGRSRSATAEQVIEQVRNLSRKYREVVLSGVNLGRWGREHGFSNQPAGRGGVPNESGKNRTPPRRVAGGSTGEPVRLVHLLRQLLEETGIERLRLSSVEPMDFSDELFQLMADSPRIAKHVHAPLQSGSDTVLRRMYRKYRPRHYEDRIRTARALMPTAAIGADVMVGFPGETADEFEQSRAFIEALPFTYLHVFTYSARPGTPAAEEAAQVPMPVRKERNRILRELAAAKNLAFRRSMVGSTLSAVTLDNGPVALTGNYLKVELAAPREPNRIVDVRIGGIGDGTLREFSALQVLQ
jgi:threonylcarbamoyladenosine tRNA methylthiotransferase MtaB